MTVEEWLEMVRADAERRGGADLVAALEGLARSTEALRAADWNDESVVRGGGPLDSPAPSGRSGDLPLR